jgi:hypothetical protein
MYNVVFRHNSGLVTWTSFLNKEAFEKQYTREKFGEIVDQGVTDARAIELCSAPRARLAVEASYLRELLDLI